MTTPSSTPLLNVDALEVAIGEVCVVEGLSFAIRPNEFWGVLGQNGVGKTTLLKTLSGLHPPTRGRIDLLGQNMATLDRKTIARHLGMLTQQTRYAFEATCHETVLIGRHPHIGPWGREHASDHAIADQALHQMGLAHCRDRSCLALSGGESRRLALATLLVQDPQVLLLDEPTNHLDPANQVSVLNVVGQQIRQHSKGGLMALHEVNLATCYCSHCLLLFGDGRWLAGPTHEMLTTQHLSKLYDCHMRLVDDGEHQVFAVGA